MSLAKASGESGSEGFGASCTLRRPLLAPLGGGSTTAGALCAQPISEQPLLEHLGLLQSIT